jgi:hypothetical protein
LGVQGFVFNRGHEHLEALRLPRMVLFSRYFGIMSRSSLQLRYLLRPWNFREILSYRIRLREPQNIFAFERRKWTTGVQGQNPDRRHWPPQRLHSKKCVNSFCSRQSRECARSGVDRRNCVSHSKSPLASGIFDLRLIERSKIERLKWRICDAKHLSFLTNTSRYKWNPCFGL